MFTTVFSSGFTPGDIRCCFILVLRSLFKAAGDPYIVCSCLLQIWLDPTIMPRWLSLCLRPRSGSFNDPRGLPLPSLLASRGVSGDIGGGGDNPGSLFLGLPRDTIQSSGKMVGVFSHPAPQPQVLVCPRLFPIMYSFW